MQTTGSISEILQNKPAGVCSVPPGATVFEAIREMADKNIGALLVMEGERLLGVVSERDYTRKVALRGKSSRETQVHEILSASLVSARPDSTVEECMRLMTEHRVRHLPVLEGGRVVGIVSIGDLVNWIISAQSQAISQLQSYISGQYPG
jgi:CBS domain-containing protein